MTGSHFSEARLTKVLGPLSPLLWGTGPADRIQSGHVEDAAESYIAIPGRASLLVPVRSLLVARRCLRAFSGSRSRTNAVLAIMGSGALMHRGMLQLLPSLSLRASHPDERLASELQRILRLSAEPHLLIRVGHRSASLAYAVIGVFDDSGRAIAYVKLDQPKGDGVSSCTRESEALQDVERSGAPIISPRLLHLGTWREATLMVTDLLPAHLRRVRLSAPDRVRLVQHISQAGARLEQPVHESAFAQSIEELLRQAHELDPPTAQVLRRVWQEMDGTISLPMGRAHGDLAPWNVGRYQQRIVVWDWEDSRARMPVGIDLVHWHFQIGLAAKDHVQAVEAAMVADDELALLGLGANQCRLVLMGYLIEHVARRLVGGELSVGEGRATAARVLHAYRHSS